MEYIYISVLFDTEIKAKRYEKNITQYNTDYPIPLHTGNINKN